MERNEKWDCAVVSSGLARLLLFSRSKSQILSNIRLPLVQQKKQYEEYIPTMQGETA
ncbi:MAG: hypothetical protein ACJAZW_001726 [Maritalea sp.]|jgi:hypothetical protein